MPELPQSVAIEHLIDIQIDLESAQNLGATPVGARSIHLISGGAFDGPRLCGTIRPGGGDWFVMLANGAGELDVRMTLQTDDGALIFLRYAGVLDAAPPVLSRALGGEDVSPSEYYFRTQPRFETGREKYAWLNKLVCIGTGIVAPGRVAYRIFAVN